MVITLAPLDPDVDEAGLLVPVRVPDEPDLALFDPDGVGVEAVYPEGVTVNIWELWYVWQLELEGMRGV